MAGAYEIIRLVHVLAAVFLVGILPLDYLLVRRAVRAGDPPRLARLLGDLEWVENRTALPAAALLLLTGLAMTVGPYRRWPLFDDPWFPTVALGLFALLIAVEAFAIPAKYKAIRQWAEGGGQGKMPGDGWQGWSLIGMTLAVGAVAVMAVRLF